jgi:hypothetical protein
VYPNSSSASNNLLNSQSHLPFRDF